MKRLMLVASLLAGSMGAHGAASIGQMTPGYTQTPAVPPTVTAGQLVTARFDVAAPLDPISWSIGISALTDTTPSGSWDWVVDEDGAYGVSKSSMKAACPTPGVMIASSTPVVHPIWSTFMVPDYGPQAVTMAFHIRARQGAQAYCVADSELYKVVVINPAPTATVTPTASRTPTGGPSMTSTPTYTVGVPPTSTSTPVTPGPSPTGTATVVSAASASAKPMIRVVVPVPNPGPKTIRFYVEGVADRVVVEFFTYGYTKVAEEQRAMVGGWAWVTVPDIGRGGFVVKATAWSGGAPTSFRIANIYCL